MKALNDKATGGELIADDWNEVPTELQNTITSSGITLSPADVEQFVKAVAHYASTSTFYTDSGSGTAYVLTAMGSNFAPPVYVNGMEIEFVPDNSNTAAATVDVAGLGVKSITGTGVADVLVAGEYVRMRFDSGTDEFVIASTSATQDNLQTGDVFASSDPGVVARGALLANGNSVSRSTYSSLFSEVGIAYGFESGSTFNLPNLGLMKNPGTTTGTTYSTITYDSPVNSTNVSINSANGDIWICDTSTDLVYKSVDDGVTFIATGSYPGTNPVSIHVDKNTGDVWVGESLISNNRIYKLSGGVGSFQEFGNYSTAVKGIPRGITVNFNNGDVFVASSGYFNFISFDSAVWKLPSGSDEYVLWTDFTAPEGDITDVEVNSSTGDLYLVSANLLYVLRINSDTFTEVAIPVGSSPNDVTVNSYTNDVWFTDTAGAVYLQPAGHGEFALVGSYPGVATSTGISVDIDRGDVLVCNFAQAELKKLTGTLDTASINWYIKT